MMGHRGGAQGEQLDQRLAADAFPGLEKQEDLLPGLVAQGRIDAGNGLPVFGQGFQGMLFVLLSPRSGLVNNLIGLAGGTPINFMNEEGWFRPIYVLSDIWQNAGFSMIIYLAALAAIDPSLHEAARVDGANRWQRMWHIDLPGIRPVISIMFILAVGNLLNIGFEKALLMQTDLNLGASQIIQTYVYDVGLKSAQFSYSAAISLFNSVLNMILLLVFNQVAKRAGQTSLF